MEALKKILEENEKLREEVARACLKIVANEDRLADELVRAYNINNDNIVEIAELINENYDLKKIFTSENFAKKFIRANMSSLLDKYNINI